MIKYRLYGILLLLFTSTKLFSQDITSSSAIVLPQSGQNSYTVNSGQTVHITSGVSITLGPGVILSSGSTVIMGINNNIQIAAPSNPAADLTKNWVLTRSFDESGNEISATKQFYDNNGKPTQIQTKNESAGHVLASQTLYDLQGRGVATTLAAPINNSAFAYNNNFITNSSNVYSYLNFDGDPTNASNPYAKLNTPDAVDNTSIGSLGWYYSNNNSFEPSVATTGLPYSRDDFYHDGTGATKRSAGVDQPLSMGSGHESTSNSFPVQNELNNYLAIRNQFFPSASVGSSPTTLAAGALQSILTDENGLSAISITDLSGKMTLMTGRADPNGWLTIANTMSASNVFGQYSFTIVSNGRTFSGGPPSPGNGGIYVDKVAGFSINSTNTVTVYQSGTLIYTGPGSNYVYAPTVNSTSYQVTSNNPFYVSATDQSGNILYDTAEAPYAEPVGASIQYFQLTNPSAVTITGNYTLYNMTTEGDITSNFNSNNNLAAGYYKVIATPTTNNSTNTVTVTYTNKYSDITYNYYNQLGQLIANIAPNGVQTLIQNGYGSYSSVSQLPFITTYQYDLQGRLIASTSPDGGTSQFIYRQDGKIRFSRNAAQANSENAGSGNVEKFSYTNYDIFGRPIESGEYAVTSATFAGLATNTTVLEATDVTGGLSGGTKAYQVNTYYDIPATNLSLPGYIQDAGFLKGAVSYTSNANSTTWYNYDDHGRVNWTVKNITGLGYKTVDYTYNDQGNITRVDYQKNTAAERFIHYYWYDADTRLVNVQTSRDDVNKLQQANYYYYLHGPLKRTELGDQLQGLDYVYTPEGWLKAINTATGDATKDPMKDGVTNGFAKDAYGMQLEYFPGDYSRAGVNISSISTGQQTYYNGNLNGLSWQSNKPSSIVSTAGAAIQNPAMYSYNYDPKYQLTGAAWGAPNFSANSYTAGSTFAENNISYDANGNIKGLQRNNSAGALSDNFNSYQYAAGTNKLNSVGNTGNATAYASYTYDELGRLKSEQPAGGAFSYYVKYDVTGKITGIYADAAYNTLKIGYAYDESGNRVSKTDNTGPQPITTYYVYDSTGNTMAIYTGTTMAEAPVYGSNRLGTYYVAANNYLYELRDNVGSVRVVLNRTKNSDGTADVVQYNDYYPFGSIAQSGGTGYRYDYQGAYAEKDPVTGFNDFKFRMYDAKIGRWLSKDFKGQFNSPYIGMGNNPANAVDPDGQLIIFVNGFYPPFGSSLKSYWGNFANQIENALGEHNALFADGNTDLAGEVRYLDGMAWASNNIKVINAEYIKTGTLVIVSHSMGDAYALGIQKVAEQNGMHVDLQVTMAPFQSKDLNAGNTKTLLFQNSHDWVAGTNRLKGTNINQFIGNGSHSLSTFNWILPFLMNSPGLPKGNVTSSGGHVGPATAEELNGN